MLDLEDVRDVLREAADLALKPLLAAVRTRERAEKDVLDFSFEGRPPFIPFIRAAAALACDVACPPILPICAIHALVP